MERHAGRRPVLRASARLSPPAPPRPLRCNQCKKVKVKCEGGVPCDRCYSRLIHCDLVGGFGHYTEFMLSPDGGLGAIVGLAKACFMRQFANGGVRRDVALGFMGSWRAQSAGAGRDVSFGLYDVISEAFGFTPLELEGREGLALDLKKPHDTHRDRPGPTKPDAAAWRERIAESQLFRALEGCGGMLAVSTVTPEGALVYAINGALGAALSTGGCMASFEARAVLPTYLFASMLDPEDREEYLDAQYESWGHTAVPVRRFIKFCDAAGHISLCLLRTRTSVPWPEHPQQRLSWATIERCPDSRHVVPQRGRFFPVMHRFKKQDGPPSPGPSSLESGPISVPPISCVPLAARPPDIVGEPSEVFADAPDINRSLGLKRRRTDPPGPFTSAPRVKCADAWTAACSGDDTCAASERRTTPADARPDPMSESGSRHEMSDETASRHVVMSAPAAPPSALGVGGDRVWGGPAPWTFGEDRTFSASDSGVSGDSGLSQSDMEILGRLFDD